MLLLVLKKDVIVESDGDGLRMSWSCDNGVCGVWLLSAGAIGFCTAESVPELVVDSAHLGNDIAQSQSLYAL